MQQEFQKASSQMTGHVIDHVTDSRCHAGLINEVNLVLNNTRHNSTHLCINLSGR